MSNQKTVMGTTLCPPSLNYIKEEDFLAVAKVKSYLHIDYRVSPQKAYTYISKRRNIEKHAFYPLIHYQDKSIKISKDTNINTAKTKIILKKKLRPLYYASHMDQLIYKYYGENLNKFYNVRADRLGIDHAVTAYRSGSINHQGKNNIHYAFDAFDFLLQNKSAFILLIDFKGFFDTIDHYSLKSEMIETLKECDPSLCSLPKDWYNVYRNLTKFSYLNKQTVHKYVSEKKQLSVIKKPSALSYFENVNEYKEFKRLTTNIVKNNTNKYGIPQGTAMSAVCANIRMVPVDLKLQEITKSYNGFYRRYSDDIIFIIPNVDNDEVAYEIKNQIYEAIDSFSSLKIENKKTKSFIWMTGKINEIKSDNSLKPACDFDYLGFNFDGKYISIKSASVSRYYTKMHRMIKGLSRLKKKYPNKYIKVKGLYERFSKLNKESKSSSRIIDNSTEKIKYEGNFITYANKSHNIMKKLESYGVEVTIKRDLDRHWPKLLKLKSDFLSY